MWQKHLIERSNDGTERIRSPQIRGHCGAHFWDNLTFDELFQKFFHFHRLRYQNACRLSPSDAISISGAATVRLAALLRETQGYVGMSELHIDTSVTVVGLQDNIHYHGQREVVEGFSEEDGRYAIRLELSPASKIFVSRENLIAVVAPPPTTITSCDAEIQSSEGESESEINGESETDSD